MGLEMRHLLAEFFIMIVNGRCTDFLDMAVCFRSRDSSKLVFEESLYRFSSKKLYTMIVVALVSYKKWIVAILNLNKHGVPEIVAP